MIKPPEIYTVDDIKHRSEYTEEPISGSTFRVRMPGQLKLLLGEIRFLTEDVQIHEMRDKHFTILYLGSGKGYHLLKLMRLYEKYDITWVLFDPNGHCSKLYELQKLSNIKIHIRDEPFLESNFDEFRFTENLLLISDIRTTNSSCSELIDESPTTETLLKDFEFQNKVLKELKPMFSLLKFRMPFPDDWKKGFEFEKPIGKEYIQAFQKKASTEFRIFLTSTFAFQKINSIDVLQDYEERFAWYNRLYRAPKDYDVELAYYIFNLCYKFEVPNHRIRRQDITKFLTNIQKSY